MDKCELGRGGSEFLWIPNEDLTVAQCFRGFVMANRVLILQVALICVA